MSLVQSRSVAHHLDHRSHAARWEHDRQEIARLRRLADVRPSVQSQRPPRPHWRQTPSLPSSRMPSVDGSRPSSQCSTPVLRKPRARSASPGCRLEPLRHTPEVRSGSVDSSPIFRQNSRGESCTVRSSPSRLCKPRLPPVATRSCSERHLLHPQEHGQMDSLPEHTRFSDPAVLDPVKASSASTESHPLKQTAEGFRSAADIRNWLSLSTYQEVTEHRSSGHLHSQHIANNFIMERNSALEVQAQVDAKVRNIDPVDRRHQDSQVIADNITMVHAENAVRASNSIEPHQQPTTSTAEQEYSSTAQNSRRKKSEAEENECRISTVLTNTVQLQSSPLAQHTIKPESKESSSIAPEMGKCNNSLVEVQRAPQAHSATANRCEAMDEKHNSRDLPSVQMQARCDLEKDCGDPPAVNSGPEKMALQRSSTVRSMRSTGQQDLGSTCRSYADDDFEDYEPDSGDEDEMEDSINACKD